MGSNLANRTDSLSRSLVALSDEAIRGERRNPHRLPSGPFHDAAEVARVRSHHHDVCAKPARHQSQQDGGHEGGASRIGGHSIRQIGRESGAVDRDALSAKVHCKNAGLRSLSRTRCKSLY